METKMRQEEEEEEATNLISFRNSSLMSLNAAARVFICLFQTSSEFTLSFKAKYCFTENAVRPTR